jgi:presqualene diphosphate synthase
LSAADTKVEQATRASGSSFYSAMRILPAAQRDAMFAIYSFCRRVDDIADSEGPRDQRQAQLQLWRADVNAVYENKPAPRMDALAKPIRDFGLAREDFLAIIDGMEMDASEDIRAPSLAKLDLYCDRVASAVGRLSVRVFGVEEARGEALAHHLGRALQLTNILRDLDEDAGIGRLYLPREALREAGIDTTDPQAALSSPGLATACQQIVDRARMHFAQADKVMKSGPRRPVRAPRIMGEVYRLILEGLVARGWSAPRLRVSVPRLRLVLILLRHAFP